jgi:cytochrome c2
MRHYLIKSFHLLALVLLAGVAQAEPFAQGDPSIGKAMIEENCISCHASKYGGDGSAIYTRENRKVNSASELIAQIRNCNTMLGLKWFEDEELHVASYLNKTYYKFE